MNFAIYKLKYGNFKIVTENDTVVYLKKIHIPVTDFGQKNKLTDNVIKEINEYFEGERKEFTFKYQLRGTAFQLKVWNELLNIPYGSTKSYKEMAILVGNEKASRAIGMANNKNPITIVVPCHRVIGSNNKLVGYAGGIDMKDDLLNMEKENAKKIK